MLWSLVSLFPLGRLEKEPKGVNLLVLNILLLKPFETSLFFVYDLLASQAFPINSSKGRGTNSEMLGHEWHKLGCNLCHHILLITHLVAANISSLHPPSPSEKSHNCETSKHNWKNKAKSWPIISSLITQLRGLTLLPFSLPSLTH